jgi:adenine-specific DNA-methyltransferase
MKLLSQPTYEPPAMCKVYTPVNVAEAVSRAVGVVPRARWLEPSAGRGAFLVALHKWGVKRSDIVAIDLDRTPHENDQLAIFHRGTDFFRWTQTNLGRFDRIVGNPPYVPLDRLPKQERDSVASLSGIPGTGNLWAAFALCSLKALRAGGSFGMLLPASWEYADYAAELRKRFSSSFEQFHVWRCKRPVFDSVEEGAVIALGLNHLAQPIISAKHECLDVDELLYELNTFSPTQYPRTKISTSKRTNAPRATISFGDVAGLRIGAVTGDVAYFLLNESKRATLRLPKSSVTPVVSKAHHLIAAELTPAKFATLVNVDRRVWLFRPAAAALKNKCVRRYLKLDLRKGGCRRTAYKIRSRKPWHQTPLPLKPHAFVSGMSGFGPYLCFNRIPRLTATNTLYTVRFGKDISTAKQFAIALGLLTSPARKQLQSKARVYAGGLRKLEPTDLSDIRLPSPKNCVGAACAYRRALASLLNGNEREAMQIADKFFRDA